MGFFHVLQHSKVFLDLIPQINKPSLKAIPGILYSGKIILQIPLISRIVIRTGNMKSQRKMDDFCHLWVNQKLTETENQFQIDFNKILFRLPFKNKVKSYIGNIQSHNHVSPQWVLWVKKKSINTIWTTGWINQNPNTTANNWSFVLSLHSHKLGISFRIIFQV